MQQHPTEITFYDELGVTRSATAEEIRDSFRSLVRLLHPDQQTDPQLKEIAERQMRKLNGVYEVLSDPDQRRRYNQALDRPNVQPTIVFSSNSNTSTGKLIGRLVWAGAFLLLVPALIWLAYQTAPARVSENSDRPSQKSSATESSGNSSALSAELKNLRAELETTQGERDTAIRELVRMREKSYFENNSEAQPDRVGEQKADQKKDTGSNGTALASGSNAKNSSAATRQFAGSWFFSRTLPAPGIKPAMLYAPEYIEATIFEQNGIITGRYRSRYKIVDRAISPDVDFEFTGVETGTSVVCPWTGAGGSKGQLTLRIAGENAMKVDWTASELGSIQGLSNGSAILTRRGN